MNDILLIMWAERAKQFGHGVSEFLTPIVLGQSPAGKLFITVLLAAFCYYVANLVTQHFVSMSFFDFVKMKVTGVFDFVEELPEKTAGEVDEE